MKTAINMILVWNSIQFCVIILDVISSYKIVDSNIAVTKYGRVLGTKLQSRLGSDFYAFRGIPYAKPPVRNLRFKNPEDIQPWEGIYNATKDGPMCIQKNTLVSPVTIFGQEDCLYLNVYTPHILSANDLHKQKKKLPVMVYIHGGGWFSGTGTSDQIGPSYIMDHKVVLVTFNYRLGVFGFLSTGTDEAVGNWAMRDTLAVLKWVQKNIEYFGGDENSVTLFGQSAGAASVHYIVLSNLFSGLFHAAIMQSGNALAAWAVPLDHSLKIAHQQAAFVNCSHSDDSAMLECLRHVDATKLVDSEKHFKFWDIEPLTIYRPSIEKKTEKNPNPLIEENPLKIVQSGNIPNKVPIIMGVVENEGALRVSSILTDAHLLEELNSNFNTLAPSIYGIDLSISDAKNQIEFWNALKKEYKLDDFINISNPNSIKSYLDSYSDRAFVYSMYQAAKLHSSYQNIYFYNFRYHNIAKSSYLKLFSKTDYNITYDFGAIHCDDLIYLFENIFFPKIKQVSFDFEMSNFLLKLWTDFSRLKNPTPYKTGLNWSTFNEKVNYYLNITGPVVADGVATIIPQMSRNFYRERMQFWSNAPILENVQFV